MKNDPRIPIRHRARLPAGSGADSVVRVVVWTVIELINKPKADKRKIMLNSLKNSWLACLLFPMRNQMWDTQPETLRQLVADRQKPGLRVLEVGSWCGHSTEIIGKVVKASDGKMICVDWWRGGDDRITRVNLLRNGYKMFWRRIVKSRLVDTVIPIRGKSGDVLPLLKDKQFDIIFLDGDHRYNGIKADIKQAKRLIKSSGTIFGHDCEGKPGKANIDFLDSHKNEDFVDGKHCGVIMAVAEEFKNYDLINNFWVVKGG